MLPLEKPAPPGAYAGNDGDRLRHRSRRLFRFRPRGSRIGAWASKQSQPLESRFALEKRVAEFTAKHAIGHVPRPEWWSGFRLKPSYFEFWHDRPFRLHDRVVFTPTGNGGWETARLYP